METPPNKPGPLTRQREGRVRAQEAGGPNLKCRPQGPLPAAERVGRAVEAPPGRTPGPAVGARRAASAAGNEAKPPHRVAVGGTRHDSDSCPGPQRAGGGGEQWTTCQSGCESPNEEGTQETRPQETWRKGQRPEVGRPGPLVHGGMKKIRDPLNSIAAGKAQVFSIGLESKGAAKVSRTWTRSHTPPKRATNLKTSSGPPGLVGQKTVDSCIGEVWAERRAC